MSDPFLLHHYEGSPFSEKVRLMLGFKGLPWVSVIVPVVMPKPDVVALTGGHRRTPFLQRGADVWCDTSLIARVLEAEKPRPTLFPASAPLAPLLAQWMDTTLFWTVIAYVMQPAGMAHLFGGSPPETMKAFAADRAPFSGQLPRPRGHDAVVQLAAALAAFEQQLADGRTHLFGDEASIADFSLAHNLWFVHRAGPLGAIVTQRPLLSAWYERMHAIGRGKFVHMASSEAVLLAAAATGHAPSAVQPALGFEAGQPVAVAAIDYGTDAVPGTLVGLSADEVVIERHDDRGGTVHVHFPRFGFRISKGEIA